MLVSPSSIDLSSRTLQYLSARLYARRGENRGALAASARRPSRVSVRLERRRERKDDLSVVGLLVVAAQEVGDGPGVVRQLRMLAAVQGVPRIPFGLPPYRDGAPKCGR